MKKQKQDGWYAKKTFPHFDFPMGFEQAKELASDPAKVTKHSFKPFIGYTDIRRKFTPKSEKNYKNKERPIKYCSHHDGYIHSYYAKTLVDSYELFLSTTDWGKCVIGYRSGLGTNTTLCGLRLTWGIPNGAKL